MKTNRTKFFSLFLVLAMLLSATTVMAAEEQAVPVILTVEAPIFSVTVPTALPVTITNDGSILTADNAAIQNFSAGPVAISDVEILGVGGWETVAYGTLDQKYTQVNTKKLALQLIFGDEATGTIVSTTGADTNDFAGSILIPKGESLPLLYDAEVPAQQDTYDAVEFAQVVFTVGWYE